MLGSKPYLAREKKTVIKRLLTAAGRSIRVSIVTATLLMVGSFINAQGVLNSSHAYAARPARLPRVCWSVNAQQTTSAGTSVTVLYDPCGHQEETYVNGPSGSYNACAYFYLGWAGSGQLLSSGCTYPPQQPSYAQTVYSNVGCGYYYGYAAVTLSNGQRDGINVQVYLC